MSGKPRILLIPDMAWWVIGEMGRQIIARFHNKYDFYFMPATILGRRPDLLKAMIPAIDAIHCISYETIDLLRDFDSRALPPIVTWIHHVTEWNSVQQMAVEMSSSVTTCTQQWKRYLDKRIAGRIPVTVIPHGVDTQFFHPRTVSRRRFGIPPGRFVVGFLGSKGSDLDYSRKGTSILFQVIREASVRLPNLHLLIGGPGWDKEIEELKAFGISVSATGYICKANIPDLYSAMDVYLLTSRVEGGPCTVFEAMACETAVVSTRVGAVPELIVDGVNGFSAEVDDGNALLSAIIELCQSAKKRIDVGRRGRETVSSRSWSAALSPLEFVYDDMVKQRRKMSLPQTGPTWMNDPDGLLQKVSAADALLTVYSRIRKGSMKVPSGLGMLNEMLREQTIGNIAKGAAMIRRYRPEA